MTRTFVLDEGVVISAHTGIDPNTGEESDEAYALIVCLGRHRHRVGWNYEAWDRYQKKVNQHHDGGNRPHVLQLLRNLASDSEIFRFVYDDEILPLEHPTELPADDHLWIRLTITLSADFATTDGRLIMAAQRSEHYRHLVSSMHLVPEALPLACDPDGR